MAGFISHIGENFKIHITSVLIQLGDKAFSFHGPVNSGDAGGHKPEVVLA